MRGMYEFGRFRYFNGLVFFAPWREEFLSSVISVPSETILSFCASAVASFTGCVKLALWLLHWQVRIVAPVGPGPGVTLHPGEAQVFQYNITMRGAVVCLAIDNDFLVRCDAEG